MRALLREPTATAESPARAPAARAGGAPGAVLALQRTAGNAATSAALATHTPRRLARCGAGGCTCGGKCGGRHGALEEDLELRRAALSGGHALARAVAARAS